MSELIVCFLVVTLLAKQSRAGVTGQFADLK